MEIAVLNHCPEGVEHVPIEAISEMLFQVFFAAGHTFYYDQDFQEPFRSFVDH